MGGSPRRAVLRRDLDGADHAARRESLDRPLGQRELERHARPDRRRGPILAGDQRLGRAGDAAERRSDAGERSARAAPGARLLLESPQFAPSASQILAELSVRRLEANPKGTYLRVSHRFAYYAGMAELIFAGPLIVFAISPFLAFLLFFVPAAIEGFKSLRD